MQDRLKNLFSDEAFWLPVIGVLAMLVVAARPEFQSSEKELVTNITYIVMLAVGGYKAQAIAMLWLARPGSIDMVVKAAGEVIDGVEERFHVDIPDTIEEAGKEELKRRLQELVADFETTIK